MMERGYTGSNEPKGYDETDVTPAIDSGETDFKSRVNKAISTIESIIDQADKAIEMIEEKKDGWREAFDEVERSGHSLLDGLSEAVLNGINIKRPCLFDELTEVIGYLNLEKRWLEQESKRIEESMIPTQREQELLDYIKPLIIEQMQQMDPESLQKYQQKDDEGEVTKEVSLFQLGYFSKDMVIGNVKCQCAAFLGEDGEFYIEGPRREASSGAMVVDIHPYSIEDATAKDGWWPDEIRMAELVEATVMSTI